MDVVQREDVPDIDDEPEEVEEMMVLAKHILKEKCVCKLPWCKASREQHKFGQFMTTIPKGDRARCVRWLHSLGHADDEEDCIVARIRAIWPSETGLYMGFKLK